MSRALTHGALGMLVLVLHALVALMGSAFLPDTVQISVPVHTQPPLQVVLLSERSGPGWAPQAAPVRASLAASSAIPEPPPPSQAESAGLAPDRPALPITAPDLDRLRGLPPPTAPVHLRMHIDAEGKVTRVDVVEAQESDEAFVQRLIDILLATAHVPARRRGVNVDSVKDLTLDFGATG